MNREPADSRHVGEHFMEFAIEFFNLAKNCLLYTSDAADE